MSGLKIVVGSLNPAKLQGVVVVCSQILGVPFEVVGVEVESGVPEQPSGEELFFGAKNRCVEALKQCPESDFQIGIEAGIRHGPCVHQGRQDLFCETVACAHRGGQFYFGISGGFALPSEVSRMMEEEGKSMGKVVGELFQEDAWRTGLVGVVTNGLVNRRRYLQVAVMYAMTAFRYRFPYWKFWFFE